MECPYKCTSLLYSGVVARFLSSIQLLEPLLKLDLLWSWVCVFDNHQVCDDLASLCQTVIRLVCGNTHPTGVLELIAGSK